MVWASLLRLMSLCMDPDMRRKKGRMYLIMMENGTRKMKLHLNFLHYSSSIGTHLLEYPERWKFLVFA